ncbi:50S ribosomal protein L5 [Candidatus Woesearchaeota archaeon CG10_big_fil_rev_8_21_14_0_10_32_24]|nr:MAG: 50S ribosomal protein L5 [Candidatus Woesearchaeota archaeon CG10_big_fil_rev_8_21_14_0_10_32_24]
MAEKKQQQSVPKESSNPMRTISVAKLTMNLGAGKDENQLKKGIKLLQKLTPIKAIKTLAKKRIPTWGLRPGLAIGAKVTVREGAEVLLKRLFVAKENQLSIKSFDEKGNFSFGIPEYIEIEGMEYDPELKIMGFEVAVTLERPGYSVKKRKKNISKIGKNHQITKEDAISFVQSLGVEVQ